MIIAATSPLRLLPSGLTEMQEHFYHAICASFDMTEIAYTRLYSTIEVMTDQTHPTRKDHALTAMALSDSWTIVDSVHRLLVLIRMLPGLKQRSPELLEFYKSIKPVIYFRNKVQHLNNEIKELMLINKSVLGYITWLSIKDSSVPIFHSGILVNNAQAGMLPQFQEPTGKEFYTPIDHISLHLSGQAITLSGMFRALCKYIPLLEAHLAQNYSGTSENNVGLIVIAEIGPTPNTSQAGA